LGRVDILVIPTTDWTKHPSPHRHHYLVEQLARNHDVTVLRFPIYDGSRTLASSARIEETGHLRTRGLGTYYLLNGPRHWLDIRRLFREREVSMILGANLLPSALAFAEARRLTKTARPFCLYDLSDYFPESAAIYARSALSGAAVKAGSLALMRANMSLADVVTTPSRPLCERVAAMTRTRVEVVPNGVDFHRFSQEVSPEPLRAELNCGENVLCFVGSLEGWLDFDTVLLGFRTLLATVPDAHLLIVGGSIQTDYEASLARRVREMGLHGRVTMTGFVPPEDVPRYLSVAKVGLIPFRTELYMAQIAIPDKLFEYLASGLYVLSTPLPEVRRVAGSHVQFYATSEEFAKIAAELLARPGRNLKGRELASKYDWGRAARRFVALAESWREGR
jgi:glycosyltransferase involved in cell wall biosynthesis